MGGHHYSSTVNIGSDVTKTRWQKLFQNCNKSNWKRNVNICEWLHYKSWRVREKVRNWGKSTDKSVQKPTNVDICENTGNRIAVVSAAVIKSPEAVSSTTPNVIFFVRMVKDHIFEELYSCLKTYLFRFLQMFTFVRVQNL